jgi:hypothetical protein
MYGLVFLLQCSFSASSTKPLQDLGFRVSQQSFSTNLQEGCDVSSR